MKTVRTTILIVSGLLLWVVGCEVSDPGSALPNQAPTTTLTRAPLEGATVNHYIELRWAGNDADGNIAGFRISVDGTEISVTTRTDTTMAFTATTDGAATSHTFSVAAFDDEGLADPSPPVRQFFTTNVAPTTAFVTGSVPSNSQVGHGFRMVLEGLDANRSLIWFSLSLGDEEHWSEWSRDSIFFVADPTLGEFPEATNIVSNESLTDGPLTIYARVKDAGDAISPTVSRVVNINSGFSPEMDPNVVGAYGSAEFYPDGSVYRRNNIETQINVEATAAAYYGQIHSYRYYDGSADVWSEWSDTPSLIFTDLPEGEYPFKFTARDIAGESADTIDYTIRIVEQRLTNLIVLVDETRDGNGNPGSPTDEDVDAAYHTMLEGRNYIDIDYANRELGTSYISPYDLKDAGLVVWAGDDRSDIKLGDNTAVLTNYLNKGGRLVLSGWDVMGAFNPNAADSLVFAAGSFAYEKLRVFEAYFARSRSTTEVVGMDGFPTITVDADKLPSSYNGTIDRVWVFRQRGECSVSGVLGVNDPGENPYEGLTASFMYDQSFRVMVMGVPLFFFKLDETTALMDAILERMLIGL